MKFWNNSWLELTARKWERDPLKERTSKKRRYTCSNTFIYHLVHSTTSPACTTLQCTLYLYAIRFVTITCRYRAFSWHNSLTALVAEPVSSSNENTLLNNISPRHSVLSILTAAHIHRCELNLFSHERRYAKCYYFIPGFSRRRL